MQIGAPSALLMEASTGTVLFEQDADTKRPPASVNENYDNASLFLMLLKVKNFFGR